MILKYNILIYSSEITFIIFVLISSLARDTALSFYFGGKMQLSFYFGGPQKY